jgi:hypothetical protein
MGKNKNIQKSQQLSKKKNHQLNRLKYFGTQDGFLFLFTYLRVRTENPCDKGAYYHECRSLAVQRGTYFHPTIYTTAHLHVSLWS